MRHAIVAAVAAMLLAGLPGSAPAQEAPTAEEPAPGAIPPGDDAMTDVDPEIVARCSGEATQKKLAGPARKDFMNACVELED